MRVNVYVITHFYKLTQHTLANSSNQTNENIREHFYVTNENTHVAH